MPGMRYLYSNPDPQLSKFPPASRLMTSSHHLANFTQPCQRSATYITSKSELRRCQQSQYRCTLPWRLIDSTAWQMTNDRRKMRIQWRLEMTAGNGVTSSAATSKEEDVTSEPAGLSDRWTPEMAMIDAWWSKTKDSKSQPIHTAFVW